MNAPMREIPSDVRIEGDKEEFRRRHAFRLRYVLLLAVPSVLITLIVLLVVTLAGKPNPNPLLVALLPGLLWTATAVAATLRWQHRLFFADELSFRPETLPLSMIMRGTQAISYEEVVDGSHSTGRNGWWWVNLRLRSGKQVLISKSAGIPDSAYRFLLEQLARRKVVLTETRAGQIPTA